MAEPYRTIYHNETPQFRDSEQLPRQSQTATKTFLYTVHCILDANDIQTGREREGAEREERKEMQMQVKRVGALS